MPAFGTIDRPVRNLPTNPIEINNPDGFMTDPAAFGDLWWISIRDSWQRSVPPAVTRATSVLVNPLCRMPWRVVRPDGSVIEPGSPGYPAWLTDPQLLNGSTGGPNAGRFAALDRTDRFDFWARLVTDALWFGVGALAFEPDSAGQPTAGTMQILQPGQVYRGSEGWAISTRSGTVEPIDDDGMVLGQRILLLRHSLPGGVFGWHRRSLALSNRIGTYAEETLDSAVPSGVLSTDMPVDQKQADAARVEWRTRQSTRSVAVLGNGTKYVPVTWSPEEAEIVGLSRLSNEALAHAFELPAWYLDASQDSGTYSNSLQWRQDLVDGPLASWDARLSETLGSLFPWGTSLDIDFTRYTKPTEPSAATNDAVDQPTDTPEV